MSNSLPSVEHLQRAIQIVEKIESLEAALKTILAGAGNAAVKAKTPGPRMAKRKHRMSAEGRARIAAAQKARWAARRNGATTGRAPAKSARTVAKGKKRSFSPEARAKMAAAARKRWAKVKRAKA